MRKRSTAPGTPESTARAVLLAVGVTVVLVAAGAVLGYYGLPWLLS